jgi:mRNA interferase RelE/StbE
VSYRFVLAPPARRTVGGRLPHPVVAAVPAFLAGDLATHPGRVGRQLLGPLAGTEAARRGEHRVLHRIDEDAALVTVIDVRHRRDAHRSA